MTAPFLRALRTSATPVLRSSLHYSASAARPKCAAGSSLSQAPSSSLSASLRRPFSLTSRRQHGGLEGGRPAEGQGITIHFAKQGEEVATVEGHEGDDLVDLAHEYDLPVEAACEKSLACSTCHVILQRDIFESLEEPSDEENDMLDLAFGLQDTSRLGCQVRLTKDMDGMTVTLPSATRNMSVDGYKPPRH